MRAAVFQGGGAVSVVDRSDPSITAADEVLIGVEVNGLCGSDLRAFAVPPQMAYDQGVVVGHEFAGRVIEVGSAVTSVRGGDRVIAIPNINCQVCWSCRTNRTNLCDGFVHIGSMRDGGAAEYTVVPERLILEIPEGLPTDLAALAEPLACVLNGTTKVGAQPGDTVLVLGGGPIGLLYLLLFKGAGATVVVSEPSELRAKAALEFGADLVVDPMSVDVGEAVRQATHGLGADIAIDAVGSLLEDAVSLVRKGGTVLVFGLDDRATASISPSTLAYGEICLQGIYIAKGTFPKALQLLESNELGFDRLITHRLELERFNEAVDLARSGEALKVLIVP